jgi:C1A family cysteine protease
MHSTLLVLLSVAYLASALHYQRPADVSEEVAFEQYNAFWNRSHASLQEKHQRFINFVLAGRKINEMNTWSTSATFGYTKFADWSYDEFKKLNGFIPSKPLNTEAPVLAKRDVKDMTDIDWVAKGMTTAVKNQGQCGSCWAFSATETVESANLIAGKSAPNGSPQEIVDCDQNDQGCNGGDPQEALQWVVNQGGLDTDNCYPYTAQDQNCQSSNCSPNRNLGISTVTPVGSDEGSIYQALMSMPLSICCDASQWQYYTGGVLTADQCGLSIDHAIQLTGFSTSQGGYWIVRNSWGSDWGLEGFIWLQYGSNTCGITSEVTAASV